MTEHDVAAVVALQEAAFPPPQVAEGGRVGEGQLREELARPWAHLWVSRAGTLPKAFLLAWHVADELHVLNVATHPRERRRGHGRALLDHALAFARAHQVRLVLLEVRRSNRVAQALYRSAGFYAMGLRLRYYDGVEDAVEMALLLDPATGQTLPRSDEVRLDDG